MADTIFIVGNKKQTEGEGTDIILRDVWAELVRASVKRLLGEGWVAVSIDGDKAVAKLIVMNPESE